MVATSVAGNADFYEFRLIEVHEDPDDPARKLEVLTPHGFTTPRVSNILDVLGKPANAMSHWGFNLGIEGMLTLAQVEDDIASMDEPTAKIKLRDGGFDPKTVRNRAGDRGTNAHRAAQLLGLGYIPGEIAEGKLQFVHEATGDIQTVLYDGYVRGALAWYAEQMTDWAVLATEEPVWCFCPDCRFTGTLDLCRQQGITYGPIEIVDFKTHKPDVQKQQERKGPAYTSDIFQGAAYRRGWQARFGQEVQGQRVVVFDEKGRYFEDTRMVPVQAWQRLCSLYEAMKGVSEDG